MNTQAGAWAVIHCPARESFLFGKRGPDVNKPNIWNLFGGHIDPSESAIEAMVRELREETGFRVGAGEIVHLGGVEDTDIQSLGYVNALRELHFFLLVTAHEIAPDLNHEHSQFKWFKEDKLPHRVNRPTAIALNIGLIHKAALVARGRFG